MNSEFGKKFEDTSKLFDHAAHNGSNCLNGHCFVSIMLCIPVWNGSKVSYLAVPPGYRMWQKKDFQGTRMPRAGNSVCPQRTDTPADILCKLDAKHRNPHKSTTIADALKPLC